jgi:hypothetical protein
MTETEYRTKLFEQLGTLDERYRRFVHRMLFAVAILTVATCWTLFVALPQKNEQIAGVRASVSAEFCRALNNNATVTNANSAYLQRLIVGGAQASRAFEPLYRAYGAPPFRVRLAHAKAQARGLNKLAVPQIDCAAFANRLRNAAR